MTIFSGNSLFIWKVKQCTNGLAPNTDAGIDQIIKVMQVAGLRYATPKIADGPTKYNLSPVPGTSSYVDDILPRFFEKMGKAGFPKIGWHYVYGKNPLAEADMAIEQIGRFKLDGYIIDAEAEYKAAGALAARQFMGRLKTAYPDIPIALCSYRYPSLHPEFPWLGFINWMSAENGDVHMPQVYWMGVNSVSAGADQFARSYKELTAIENMPVTPVGAMYGDRVGLAYWKPTREQCAAFAKAAFESKCPGVSWWSWDEIAKLDISIPMAGGKTGYWEELMRISTYPWAGQNQPPTPPQLTIEERVARLESEARKRGWDV